MNDTKAFTRNPWAAMSVLVLGLFMTLLDLTIVNIAIPRIVDGLHASLDQVLWVLNAYSLLYAVLLITSARLGDVFGPRRMFAAGVAIFTAASAASGLAQDPTQLIIARAAQGLGAAVLAPQSLPIMLRLFPADRRGGVFAVYGVIAGLAVVAGPTLGGLLVTNFGWRWIFYVNIPVGVLTFVLALILLPGYRTGLHHRFDVVGVLLVTAGLLGVVFGLIEGQRYDWGTVTGAITIPEIIGAGVVVLAVFFVHQALRQDREPLLPFKVFSDRNFTLMTVVMAGMGFAILGAFLPLTIYLQSVLGLSAIQAGLTIAPQPIAMMISSSVAAPIGQKVNGKYLLIPGLLLFAAGLGYIDWTVQAGADRWVLLPGLIGSGLGLGCIWIPVFGLATRDLRPELAGVASGVMNTIQELGTVIASAAVGAVLQNQLAMDLHNQAVKYSAQLPPSARDGFVSGFSHAARHGLEIGVSQAGSGLGLTVFTHAFVDAMRVSMLLPIAVIVFAAVVTFGVRASRGQATEADREAA